MSKVREGTNNCVIIKVDVREECINYNLYAS